MFKKEQEIYFENTKDFVIDFKEQELNRDNIDGLKKTAQNIVNNKSKCITKSKDKNISR